MHLETSSDSSENSDIDDVKKGEDGWEDTEPDQEIIKFVSLMDSEEFTDIHTMFRYCRENFDLDFLGVRQRLALDFYDCIKLVNYIRAQVHQRRSHLISSSMLTKSDFEDEKYLKPFLEDDAVLYTLDELPDNLQEVHLSDSKDICEKTTDSYDSKLVTRVSQLEEELRRIQGQFDNYRATVARMLDGQWQERPSVRPDTNTSKEKPHDDSHYFNSYAYNDIHEIMLKDTVRTDAYRDFIYSHKNLFTGKTVLDVGCGSGILSMFCAKAGAKQVIAVDNSSIIEKARENVFNNHMGDQIKCLRGKIEEVTLPVESVDIIVSEWMGYCMLYEAMLDSVIWARDKYLKPDGLILPSHMTMWVAPIADPEYIADHILFWRDVYGFDMKAMQAGIYEEALVLDMPHKVICGKPFQFLELNLYTTRVKDLSFITEWQSKFTKDVDALDGFILWFDTFFMPRRSDVVPSNLMAENWPKDENKGNAFTTGPYGKLTHWKQGVMLIDSTKDEPAPRKSGQEITAKLEFSVPKENPRALTITIEWSCDKNETKHSQIWQMR